MPLIQASVEKLGFKFSDIKVLLISHAHGDHCAGNARVKELTGAKYMVMDADVPVVESGGKADFQIRRDAGDLRIHADESGSRAARRRRGAARRAPCSMAHLTPGHTKELHDLGDEGKQTAGRRTGGGDRGQSQT